MKQHTNLIVVAFLLIAAITLSGCSNSNQPEDDISDSVKGKYMITYIVNGNDAVEISNPNCYILITKVSSNKSSIQINMSSDPSDNLYMSNVQLSRKNEYVVFTYGDTTGSLIGAIKSTTINIEVTGKTSGSLTFIGEKQ